MVSGIFSIPLDIMERCCLQDPSGNYIFIGVTCTDSIYAVHTFSTQRGSYTKDFLQFSGACIYAEKLYDEYRGIGATVVATYHPGAVPHWWDNVVVTAYDEVSKQRMEVKLNCPTKQSVPHKEDSAVKKKIPKRQDGSWNF